MTTSGVGGASHAAVNPYVAQYNAMQRADAAELLTVISEPPQAQQENIVSVLSQWAALQAQQNAAEQRLRSQPPPPIRDQPVPSLTNVLSQSDAAANAAIDKYVKAQPGSSILDFQA